MSSVYYRGSKNSLGSSCRRRSYPCLLSREKSKPAVPIQQCGRQHPKLFYLTEIRSFWFVFRFFVGYRFDPGAGWTNDMKKNLTNRIYYFLSLFSCHWIELASCLNLTSKDRQLHKIKRAFFSNKSMQQWNYETTWKLTKISEILQDKNHAALFRLLFYGKNTNDTKIIVKVLPILMCNAECDVNPMMVL